MGGHKHLQTRNLNATFTNPGVKSQNERTNFAALQLKHGTLRPRSFRPGTARNVA